MRDADLAPAPFLVQTTHHRAVTEATSSSPLDLPALDALTGGAITAPTSGERSARIREWLAAQPPADQLQAVFRELSGRDKGATKPVRERLDELKRARHQEAAASEWAHKAEQLLQLPRLNMADALAWQRDAAKAGAPLGRTPLAELKNQLAERVRSIEDLQNRVQVQREAAVLLAQRTEVLSTKPWRDAQAALAVLQADITHWQTQADALVADVNWSSVDARFAPQLEASRAQLQGVWDAFSAALEQAGAAAANAAAPLPPVPVWAEELRSERGMAPAADQPAVAPELRARAQETVQAALQALEQEVAQGHGKASAGAAAALRAALKEHARLIDNALDQRAQAALVTAGELEGWQRWRADQLREELVRKAESLLGPPPPVPVKLKTARPERNANSSGQTTSAPLAGTAPDKAAALPDQAPAPETTMMASDADADSAAAVSDQSAELETTTAAPALTARSDPATQLPDLAAEPLDPADERVPQRSDVAMAPVDEPDAAAQLDALMVAGEDMQAQEDAEHETAHEEAAVSSSMSAGAQQAVRADSPAGFAESSPHAQHPVPSPNDHPRKPRMGGRKLQETLRALREQWRQVDRGGVPNHALWRRFDHACNEAHKFVDEWLDQVRAQAAEHRGQRLALIEEVNAWAADNRSARDDDWKGFARIVRDFGERWRASGHLNEKAFAELQPQWKQTLANAAAPLEAVQQQSVARRQAMIEEANVLGAAPMLRIDAVKSLQQRWQAEAQWIPLERRQEQKLWDTFRKPIDDAFNRKTAEREQADAAMGERDRRRPQRIESAGSCQRKWRCAGDQGRDGGVGRGVARAGCRSGASRSGQQRRHRHQHGSSRIAVIARSVGETRGICTKCARCASTVCV